MQSSATSSVFLNMHQGENEKETHVQSPKCILNVLDLISVPVLLFKS